MRQKLKNNTRWLPLVLLGMLLLFGCSAIKKDKFPVLSSAEEKKMNQALDSFAQGDYSKSKELFSRTGKIVEDKAGKRQAELGMLLSDFFLCQGAMECTPQKNELNQFLQNQEEASFVDFRLVIPMVSVGAENIRQANIIESMQEKQKKNDEQLREIQARYDSDIQRLQELEEENSRLREQIQELEELFDLIEQKKRQRFE